MTYSLQIFKKMKLWSIMMELAFLKNKLKSNLRIKTNNRELKWTAAAVTLIFKKYRKLNR